MNQRRLEDFLLPSFPYSTLFPGDFWRAFANQQGAPVCPAFSLAPTPE